MPDWVGAVLTMSAAPALAVGLEPGCPASRLPLLGANAAVERRLGRPLSGALGRPIVDAAPELAGWVSEAAVVAAKDRAAEPSPLELEAPGGVRLRALARERCLVLVELAHDGTADALRADLARRDALLRELHHGVRNHLQVVASFAGTQLARIAGPEARAQARALEGRIHAIALVHAELHRSPTTCRLDLGAHVRELAEAIRQLYGAEHVALSVEAASLLAKPDLAIDCGLVLHELLGNCFRHAFGSRADGRVEVRLERAGATLVLTVSDDGADLGSLPPARASSTLGVTLVEQLARKHGGDVTWTRRGGVHAAVRLPARLIEEAP